MGAAMVADSHPSYSFSVSDTALCIVIVVLLDSRRSRDQKACLKTGLGHHRRADCMYQRRLGSAPVIVLSCNSCIRLQAEIELWLLLQLLARMLQLLRFASSSARARSQVNTGAASHSVWLCETVD